MKIRRYCVAFCLDRRRSWQLRAPWGAWQPANPRIRGSDPGQAHVLNCNKWNINKINVVFFSRYVFLHISSFYGSSMLTWNLILVLPPCRFIADVSVTLTVSVYKAKWLFCGSADTCVISYRFLGTLIAQLLDLEGGICKNLILQDISGNKASDGYLGGDGIEFRPEHRRLLLRCFVVLRRPSWKLPEAAVTER